MCDHFSQAKRAEFTVAQRLFKLRKQWILMCCCILRCKVHQLAAADMPAASCHDCSSQLHVTKSRTSGRSIVYVYPAEPEPTITALHYKGATKQIMEQVVNQLQAETCTAVSTKTNDTTFEFDLPLHP